MNGATRGTVSATKAWGPPPMRATAAVAPWRARSVYHHSDRTPSTVRTMPSAMRSAGSVMGARAGAISRERRRASRMSTSRTSSSLSATWR